MLNQRVDILEAHPPLLLSMPGNAWHLVISLEKITEEKYHCTCIKQQDDSIQQYMKEISETPFHVGDGIWELSYGCELMTLLHSNLADHPATLLWQQWHKSN